MATVNEKMTALANAIRSKTGLSQEMSIDDMTATINAMGMTGLVEPTNAAAANLLTGKTAYIYDGENVTKITGTIDDRTGWNGKVIDSKAGVIIPAGYHDGTQYVTVDDYNLKASNIKAGVTILGVTGTLEEKISVVYSLNTSPIGRYTNDTYYSRVRDYFYSGSASKITLITDSEYNFDLCCDSYGQGVVITYNNQKAGSFDSEYGIGTLDIGTDPINIIKIKIVKGSTNDYTEEEMYQGVINELPKLFKPRSFMVGGNLTGRQLQFTGTDKAFTDFYSIVESYIRYVDIDLIINFAAGSSIELHYDYDSNDNNYIRANGVDFYQYGYSAETGGMQVLKNDINTLEGDCVISSMTINGMTFENALDSYTSPRLYNWLDTNISVY